MNVDVRQLLDRLGLPVPRHGRELRTHCPNPKHAKKPGPGSWQIRLDGDRAGLHVCFGCGFGGGPVDLVAMVRGSTKKEARAWLITEFGLLTHNRVRLATSTKFDDDDRPLLTFPPGTAQIVRDGRVQVGAEEPAEYLLGRGLSLDDIERYTIGFVPFDSTLRERQRGYSGRVIVPVVVRGELVDFVARLYVPASPVIPKALSGQRDKGARKELALWGFDFLTGDEPNLVVTEGVWGALAVIRAGLPAVAACGSAWSPERTELLRPWREIVLIPDGDAAGALMVQRTSGLRFGHYVRLARLPPGEQPDTTKTSLICMVDSAQEVCYSPTSSVRLRVWEGK